MNREAYQRDRVGDAIMQADALHYVIHNGRFFAYVLDRGVPVTVIGRAKITLDEEPAQAAPPAPKAKSNRHFYVALVAHVLCAALYAAAWVFLK